MDIPQQLRWRRLYLAALAEPNFESGPASLSVAEDAVFDRLFELEGTTGTADERRALENTIQELRLLRNKSSQFRV